MANEDKFTGRADVYARYRPTYPAECVDWIMEAGGLAEGDAVADIGAGTGIFSGLLLGRGLRVWAVEPNADMRAQARAAHGANPAFTLVDAPAEATGLAAHSIRLVTAAQAFHWFDPEAFAAECRRILQPGGCAAIVWNTRDEGEALVQAYSALRNALCPAYRTSGLHANYAPGVPSENLRRFFGSGEITPKLFENPLVYTEETFIGHAVSASYAPGPGTPERTAYLAGLREFFAKHAKGGALTMPNLTEVYFGAM